MRWKIALSYLGTQYAGWQRQPGDMTVQQVLEEALTTILRQPIEVVGCGRTDAGVHARHYIAHFDAEPFDISKAVYHTNAILPADIAIQSIAEESSEFHARFDATARLYRYYLHFEKNPFLQNTSYYFHQAHDINHEDLHESAALFLLFEQFKPFCKTGSDADHYRCKIMESSWEIDEHKAVYTIRANRFLRGMVRLIVGASLNVGIGKITVEQIKESLSDQSAMPHAWSVPAQGLFLEEIVYGK
jgi:tRNA pseudouridine38-40 synthase